MSCRIKRKDNGAIDKVYAPNGKESKLYKDLVDLLESNPELGRDDAYVQSALSKGLIRDKSPSEMALALWSKVYTPEYKDRFGNWDKASDVPDSTIESLNTELSKFFRDFNIRLNKYEQIHGALDKTELFSATSKILSYKKGTPISGSAAFLAVKLLGKRSNKLYSEMKLRIKAWDKYDTVFKNHVNNLTNILEGYSAKNIEQIATDKTIVDFLKETIELYYQNRDDFKRVYPKQWNGTKDFSTFSKFIRSIVRLIEKYFYGSSYSRDRLNDIGRTLAREIITRDYHILDYSLPEGNILKSYNRTLSKDPVASAIVTNAERMGLKLTGSLGLRKVGKVFRAEEEVLNDLDFIVPYDLVEEHIKDANIAEKDSSEVPEYIIDNVLPNTKFFKDFKSKYPNFKILNSFVGKEHRFNNSSVTITGVIDGEFDSQGNHIENTGILIDFFVRLDPKESQHLSPALVAVENMESKLEMGKVKHLTDYKYFVPFIRTDKTFTSPKWVYSSSSTGIAELDNSTESDEVIKRRYNESVGVILKKYIDHFNINYRDVRELEKVYNISNLGVFDIINKTIYSKNEEVPPEVGVQVILMMLGKDHPYTKSVFKASKQWKEYNSHYKREFKKYKNIDKVNFVIASRYLASEIDSKLSKGFKKSVGFIKRKLNRKGVNPEQHDVINLVNAIINQDLSVIDNNVPENFTKVNRQKALAGNDFARRINDIVTSNGGRLSGSIAVADFSNIYRDKEEQIHDLDYTVDSENIAEKIIYEFIKNPKKATFVHNGIKNKDYTCYTILVLKDNYEFAEISRYKRNWRKGNLLAQNTIIKDTNTGRYFRLHESMCLTVDLFARDKFYPKFDSVDDLASFDAIFKGKQSLARKHPFFFSRKKDIKDYVLASPLQTPVPNVNFTTGVDSIKLDENGEPLIEESGIYYQLDNQGVRSDKDIAGELAPVLDKYGISLTSIEEYARLTGKTFDEAVVALADPFRRIIAIAKGRGDSTTLPEELAHIVIENNLNTYELRRALKYVELTPEYSKYAEEYRERYKLDDPQASAEAIETKVKKEILGKLLGKHILKKIERKGNNALLRMLRRMWSNFLSLFKNKNVTELENKLESIASDILDVSIPTTSDVSIRGSLYSENPQVEIVVDDKVVGNIFLENKGGELRIVDIEIQESLRNQGIGERAYTELGELAHANGLQLVSDTKRSGAANRVWRKLSKTGKAQKNKLKYYYVPVGVYYQVEEGTRKIIDDFIISLNARIKKLSKRGADNLNVRNQRRVLSREAKQGYAALGVLKFLRLLNEDSSDAISYIQEITKDKRLYEYFTNPDTSPERLKQLRKELKGAKLTARKIVQLHEFVSYYKPYLKDLEAYIGQKEGVLSDLKRGAILKAIRHELEKFRQIEAFKNNVRAEMAEETFRKNFAEELKLDINDPDIDQKIADKLGFDWKAELYEFRKDSPKLEYLFGSLRDASDQLMRLVQIMVVRIKQAVRSNTINFGRELMEKAKELGVAGKSFNWAYERDNDGYTGFFISPWNVKQFKEAQRKFHESLHAKYGYPEDFEERLDLKDQLWEWQAKQAKGQALTPYQITQLEKYRKYNKEIAKWYFKNTQPLDNIKDIIAERKRVLSKNQYKLWYRRSIGTSRDIHGRPFNYYKGDLVRPTTGRKRTSPYNGDVVVTNNYSNPNWEKLSQNQKDFLRYVLEKKKEMDNALPVNAHPSKAPQITESFMDILHNQKGDMFNRIGINLREGLRIQDEDYLQGEEPERRPDGSIIRYVPIRFTKMLDNTNIISTDLISGMVAYFEMVDNFKKMTEKLPEFEIIQQQFGDRILHHTKKGKTPTRGRETTSYQMLDKFLEMNISEMRKADLVIAGFNATAALQKLAQYVRANNLAWNVATQFVNMISSTGFSLIEDLVGEHTTLKSKAWAHKEFWSNAGAIFTDVADPMSDNKMLLLMRHMGISYSIRELFDNLDKARAKNLMTDAGMYKGYQIGDFLVKSKVMLAALHNYREYEGKFYTKAEFDRLNNNVDYYSLTSAYDKIDVKDGKLVFNIPDKEVEIMFSRVRYISNQVDGRLSEEDYAAIHQHAVFSLIAIHRNWLISGIQRRWRKRGYNFETGKIEEGHYNAVGRKIVSVGSMLKKMYMNEATMEDLRVKLTNGWSNLDHVEKTAVKRVAWEIGFATLAATVAVMLNRLSDDDDDDNYTLDLAAYLGNRVAIEMSSFQNPQEFITVVKDPFVPLRLIEYSFDFTDLLDGSEIEKGPWEGWSKRQRFFMRLFPGVKSIQTMSDPSAANQFLKTKPLKQLYNLVEE